MIMSTIKETPLANAYPNRSFQVSARQAFLPKYTAAISTQLTIASLKINQGSTPKNKTAIAPKQTAIIHPRIWMPKQLEEASSGSSNIFPQQNKAGLGKEICHIGVNLQSNINCLLSIQPFPMPRISSR